MEVRSVDRPFVMRLVILHLMIVSNGNLPMQNLNTLLTYLEHPNPHLLALGFALRAAKRSVGGATCHGG
jgi:hypothetical protein